MLTKELIANVRRIEIRTRRIVDELTAGAYHSVFKGRGMEFDEVREYQPGDDVRTIDWNVTARFGRPFIKKFVEERELTVFLVVDVSGSGDFGSTDRSKNEHAAELAALLAFSAIRNNDRVALLLFTDDQELFVPPRKGRRHVLRLVRDLLAWERTRAGTDIARALESMMRLADRRAIVFLISDLLDSGFDKALAVAARRHDVVALRIMDRREVALPRLGNVWVEDAESGEIQLFPGSSQPATQRFGIEAGGLRLSQEELCRKTGVDLIDITCGEDYVRPLMQFFRAREKRR
ncbi:MAG: DUF58 domain-containing protein [Kiritimatiellaeota bacterium]|nr:DUF58 domain-containing protein [Kiritimatiellota bacterium]